MGNIATGFPVMFHLTNPWILGKSILHHSHVHLTSREFLPWEPQRTCQVHSSFRSWSYASSLCVSWRPEYGRSKVDGGSYLASNLQTNKVLFNFLTVFSLTSCGLGVWHHIASCVGDCEQHNFRTLHYPLSSRMMLATNNSFRESHQSYPIYFVQSIISPIQWPIQIKQFQQTYPKKSKIFSIFQIQNPIFNISSEFSRILPIFGSSRAAQP